MNLQTAAQIESSWKDSPRWKGVERGYTAADVVRLRGTVHVEHSLARLGAEKLWRYLHELPFVNALGALTEDQRDALRRAGSAAQDEALAGARNEDSDGAENLCGTSMRLVEASPEQLDALRLAVEPIHDGLASDPAAREALEAIKRLKTEVGAPPATHVCGAPTASATEVDGVYQVRFPPEGAAAAVAECPVLSETPPPTNAEGEVVIEMTLRAGTITTDLTPYSAPTRWVIGTYSVFRDEISITEGARRITGRFTPDDTTLEISDLVVTGLSPTEAPCMYELAFTSATWVRMDGP